MTELFMKQHRGSLDENSTRLLDVIVDSAARMKRLIRAILEFASVEHTAGSEAQPVDTHAAVEAALEQLRGSIEEAGARITLDRLPAVQGHEEQLVRLFQNLIGNGIKYRSDRTPEIRISVEPHKTHWTFSVRDNGRGIEPKYFDKVFQTFSRLNGGSGAPRGSGLGLATCKRIVEAHGGHIWVESEPGKGSNFRFILRRSITNIGR
jgi:signal transduction histidine kinase